VILPGQTIGIIGGGQLGRMMAIEAKYMGYQVVVLDPTSDCPTAQVSDDQIVANYDDLEAIKKLTEVSDVVTYEFENVDLQAARYIEEQGKLPQRADLLKITQNRDQEKNTMKELQIPVSPFLVITKESEVESALASIGYPAVIKTCQGGYDGKGQLKIDSEEDIAAVKQFMTETGQRYIIEKWVDFDKEISVVLTRNFEGEIQFFPIAENSHKDHILDETIAPAIISDQLMESALEAAEKIATHLQVVGSFAIEMFVKADEIYINEMAPRPHNSGHYTIEACNVNQFDQHIRAVCGLALHEVHLQELAFMKNILGEDLPALLEEMPSLETGYVHLYGKAEVKEKRKMGHVTFIAQTEDERKQMIRQFREALG